MKLNFKTIILEALNKEQKEMVNGWQRGDYSFSDHAFDNDPKKMIIHYPLNNSDEPPIKGLHEDVVANHIEKNNGKLLSYRHNLAVDKHGRTTKATTLLKNNTGLLNNYNTDHKARDNSTKSDEYIVAISRHPHDVAGMSTGQNWTSCMDLDGGSTADTSLPHDIREGTHVAYCYHASDPSKPVARYALKPLFDIEDEDNDEKKILYPEPTLHGDHIKGFEKSVHKWATDNFGEPEEGRHFINPNLYDDGMGKRAEDFVHNHIEHIQNGFVRSRQEMDDIINHPYYKNHDEDAATLYHNILLDDGYSTNKIHPNDLKDAIISKPSFEKMTHVLKYNNPYMSGVFGEDNDQRVFHEHGNFIGDGNPHGEDDVYDAYHLNHAQYDDGRFPVNHDSFMALLYHKENHRHDVVPHIEQVIKKGNLRVYGEDRSPEFISKLLHDSDENNSLGNKYRSHDVIKSIMKNHGEEVLPHEEDEGLHGNSHYEEVNGESFTQHLHNTLERHDSFPEEYHRVAGNEDSKGNETPEHTFNYIKSLS